MKNAFLFLVSMLAATSQFAHAAEADSFQKASKNVAKLEAENPVAKTDFGFLQQEDGFKFSQEVGKVAEALVETKSAALSEENPMIIAAYNEKNERVSLVSVVNDKSAIRLESEKFQRPISIKSGLAAEDIVSMMYSIAPRTKYKEFKVVIYKKANTTLGNSLADEGVQEDFGVLFAEASNIPFLSAAQYQSALTEAIQCNCCRHKFCKGALNKGSKKVCDGLKAECKTECDLTCR